MLQLVLREDVYTLGIAATVPIAISGIFHNLNDLPSLKRRSPAQSPASLWVLDSIWLYAESLKAYACMQLTWHESILHQWL